MYRGVHIQMSQEVNYLESPCPAGATSPVACLNPAAYGPRYVPIDPTIVQKNIYKSIGNSIYHGLTASLRKRFGNHFQAEANYTWSKAIDDQTDFNSAFSAFLPTRLNLDRAVSAFDVRHNFVANAVIITPFKSGPGHNALARAFADVNISPIVQMRSAIPFTIRLGSDVNGDTHGTYDRPFKASRNSGRVDKYYNASLRVNKQFYIDRERGTRVEFITELTNMFNRTNFLSVNDVFGVTTPFLLGPFDIRGTKDIKSTSPLGFNSALPPFQAQFGLRIAF